MGMLIDTTLREGAQTVGVNLTLPARKAVIRGLAAIGVEEAEVGIVSAGNSELLEVIDYCRGEAPGLTVSLWSLCRPQDIRLAAALGPDILALSVPVSDIHLNEKLHKSREWVEAILIDAVTLAKGLGLRRISLGLEDATRADTAFVARVVSLAAKLGVFRIRLADTVGVASPGRIQRMVGSLRGSGLDLGVHCHNDFGMASANSVAALEAGASWADVTILGLGERSGSARLEEVAAYLVLEQGHSYHLEQIAPLSRFMADLLERPIPHNRPIIGRDIFACETGLHLQGLERSPRTYEPFPPEKVGAARVMLYGHKAGRRGRGSYSVSNSQGAE